MLIFKERVLVDKLSDKTKKKYEWLYNKSKKTYGTLFWELNKIYVPFLNALPYTTLLDVGCGGGKYLDLLGSQYKKIYGVDWVVEPHVKSKNFHFFKTDAWDIPLPDKSVDITISLDFFEHVDPHRLGDVFEEMLRVTKSMMIFKIEITSSSFNKEGLEKEFGEGEGELHISQHPLDWWIDFFNNYPITSIFSPYMNSLKNPTSIGIIM